MPKKDTLILGCKDDGFTQPVTIPYEGKSFVIERGNIKGNGMTQLAATKYCNHLECRNAEKGTGIMCRVAHRRLFKFFILDLKNELKVK
jgi:hypothetical protein